MGTLGGIDPWTATATGWYVVESRWPTPANLRDVNVNELWSEEEAGGWGAIGVLPPRWASSARALTVSIHMATKIQQRYRWSSLISDHPWPTETAHIRSPPPPPTPPPLNYLSDRLQTVRLMISRATRLVSTVDSISSVPTWPETNLHFSATIQLERVGEILVHELLHLSPPDKFRDYRKFGDVSPRSWWTLCYCILRAIKLRLLLSETERQRSGWFITRVRLRSISHDSFLFYDCITVYWSCGCQRRISLWRVLAI